MSQFTTEAMSRLILAGTREQLPATVRIVADLRAVHINDYVGNDEGLSLGKPEDDSEDEQQMAIDMKPDQDIVLVAQFLFNLDEINPIRI